MSRTNVNDQKTTTITVDCIMYISYLLVAGSVIANISASQLLLSLIPSSSDSLSVRSSLKSISSKMGTVPILDGILSPQLLILEVS